MTRLIIDTGTEGNSATGDTLRTAMSKINDNFLEVYNDLAASGLGGQLTNATTNGDVKIQPNGTGIVEVDQLQINNDAITSLITNSDLTLSGNGTGNVHINDGSLIVGVNDTNAVITTLGTGDLTLSTNGGTNSGTIEIKDGANGDITIENNGSGDILLKAGGQVGIGAVSSPDTSLHIKTAAAKVTLQRTADANTPGISFQQSGGNVRAELMMDGTSGTSNEVFVKTHDGSSLAERFRVQHTGAKVSGILKIGDGSTSDNYAGFGDDDDLKIFHNGSHSIIRETGTGSLYLQSDTNVIIGKDSSSETMIKGVADGAVELYHDNVKKFETSSSGVTVVDEVHTEGATPHLTLKRTNNANVPTLRFKGSGGTVGASIGFDGTSGTSNELVLQTHDSSLSERFRVTLTGAKVSGHLEVTGAQVDFTALPTSDPGVAGRLFRSGNDVKISTG